MADGDDKQDAIENAKNGAIGCGCLALLLVLGIGFCSLTADPTIEQLPDPPEAGSASPETQQAIEQFFASATNSMARCDATGQVLAESAASFETGELSQYDAFEIASAAANACQAEWLAFDSIEIPEAFETPVRVRAEDAKEKCKLFLFGKKELAETAMAMFNGDLSPATVSEMKNDGNFVALQQIECAGAIAMVASQAGGTLQPED